MHCHQIVHTHSEAVLAPTSYVSRYSQMQGNRMTNLHKLWRCPETGLAHHRLLGNSSRTCACDRRNTSSGRPLKASPPSHLAFASILKFHQWRQHNGGILLCSFLLKGFGNLYLIFMRRRILNVEFFYIFNSLDDNPNRNKHRCMRHTILTHKVSRSSPSKVAQRESQPNTCADTSIWSGGGGLFSSSPTTLPAVFIIFWEILINFGGKFIMQLPKGLI